MNLTEDLSFRLGRREYTVISLVLLHKRIFSVFGDSSFLMYGILDNNLINKIFNLQLFILKYRLVNRGRKIPLRVSLIQVSRNICCSLYTRILGVCGTLGGDSISNFLRIHDFIRPECVLSHSLSSKRR